METACARGKASRAARVRLVLVGLLLLRAHWQRAGALFLASATIRVRIRIGTVRKPCSAHAAAVRFDLVVNALMLRYAVFMWGGHKNSHT